MAKWRGSTPKGPLGRLDIVFAVAAAVVVVWLRSCLVCDDGLAFVGVDNYYSSNYKFPNNAFLSLRQSTLPPQTLVDRNSVDNIYIGRASCCYCCCCCWATTQTLPHTHTPSTHSIAMAAEARLLLCADVTVRQSVKSMLLFIFSTDLKISFSEGL